MKDKISAIILGAGKELKDNNSSEKSPPTSLLKDQYGTSVLKWILDAFKSNNINKISFVGGYEIERIGKSFPELEFIYNATWEKTGVLESFYHARKLLYGPILFSYGDIVYTSDVVKKLINDSSKGIKVAFDASTNDYFYNSGQIRKNLVRVKNNIVEEIGFLTTDSSISGEFIGLVYFDKDSTNIIREFFTNIYSSFQNKSFEQAKRIEHAYITDLLRYLKSKGSDIHGVNIGKNWAEINDRESLPKFVIGTKSDTLEKLDTALSKSKLSNQITFNISKWNGNKEKVINKINSTFNNVNIAIRSSSFFEDSFKKSNAGAFQSFLNINPKDTNNLSQAINAVIDSYGLESLELNNHQVLIQEMVEDVSISGVVFTRDIETGAPYYVISYDDTTSKTDTVTSGTSSHIKSVMISKFYNINKIPKPFNNILESVKEIEYVTGYNSLDIEFAINQNNDIFILQVRPIVSKWDKTLNYKNKDAIENLDNFLVKKLTRNPNLFGKTTIFSDMTDWNPAEMIGSHPRPLAYSVYDYLIMDKTWRNARGSIGYNNPKSTKLMVNLLGHAFVDVRASFNNLMPSSLPNKLFEKLINFYLEKLKNNPHMHDKVEFEVLFTCLDFSFDEKMLILKENNFTSEEISTLKKHLFQLTNNIIKGKVYPINRLIKLYDIRSSRSVEIIKNYSKNKDRILTIKLLLDDCIRYGTFPFSILARYAFIANSLLRSLVEKNILSENRLNEFLYSINTVATDLVSDLNKFNSGEIDKSLFINKYGHLRPGTYDITSKKYSENFEFYFQDNQLVNNSDLHDKVFSLTKNEEKNINKLIKEYGFSFNIIELLNFSKKSISMREYGKFEFSKGISDIFDLIIEFGNEFKINREDLSYLNIYDILNDINNVDPHKIKSLLINIIEKNRRIYKNNKTIYLPHIITNRDDINFIKIPDARPNYVTQGKVSAPILFLENNNPLKNLSGKIILIEGADPGFDWIFTHKILGLITKYGGSASHMTIRANEFNLPAAIGCGEKLFSKITKGKIVELNCAEKYINVY